MSHTNQKKRGLRLEIIKGERKLNYEKLRRFLDKWEDRTKTFSPFGSIEEEDYEESNDDEWKPLGGDRR